MPQHAKNPQHRFYFYPIPPPEDVHEWQLWPTYNVCIPGPLISYLLNVMRVYQWEGRVKSDDPSERQAFVEAWSDLIARVGASVECDPMPYPILRQNPADTCQMQQSIDGGETWVTVFDSSICQPIIPPMIRFRQNPSNVLQVQQSHDGGSSWTLAFTFSAVPALTAGDTLYITNTLQTNLTNIVNTYNTAGDTVISIAPDFVFDGSSNDDFRELLLCWGCREVVRISCEMVLAARAKDAIGMGIASFVLTVVGVVIAAGGSAGTGGFGTPFFVGLGAAISGIAGTLWAGITTDQLNNETVRENVACCMYNALSGSTPDRAAFAASLNGCEFEFGSVEAQMAGAIAASLDSDEVHASWLDYAQQNYRAAELGLLTACPCEDEEPPPDCLDFTTSANGWFSNPGGGGGWGVRDSGGLAGQLFAGDGLYYFDWRMATVSGSWTEIEVHFNQSVTGFELLYGGTLIMVRNTGTIGNVMTASISTKETATPFPFTNGSTWVLRPTNAGKTVPSSLRVTHICLIEAE